MATVYKQFTAQDIALIPFNAHKQYDFNSSTAASNSASFYSTRWTSESIDIYSSGSASADASANTIKYNQIDKLYYRNYFTQLHDKLGPIEFIKQPRNLYEKANILSIPMGLYGNEIKPGSFYLSSSTFDIIDDRYGNLMISGSDTGSYPSNINENVFRLDPIKGFKKYDLGVYEGYAVVSLSDLTTSPFNYEKHFYRKGTRIPNFSTTYSSFSQLPIGFYPKDYDDSFFRNSINYTNVTFNTSSLGSTSHKFPKINFNGASGSLISSSHAEKFNFNGDEDFSISFWIKPKGIKTTSDGIEFGAQIENGFVVGDYSQYLVDNKKRYILSKSRIKTIHPTYNIETSQDPLEANSEIQFPYEIYMQSSSLFFNMSDGNEVKSTTTQITGVYGNNFQPVHIFCQNSGSIMQLYKNGTLVDSTTISFKDQTRNTSNLYIGTSGGNLTIDQSGGVGSSAIEGGFVVQNYVNSTQTFHRHFNGDLNNINIWSRAYNTATITNISESINASPYIGNLFYKNGFATITHPSYYTALNTVGVGEMTVGGNPNNVTFEVGANLPGDINTLQFQGTHLIYENEYQCTVQEHEFNDTTNLSARKFKSTTSHQLADFTTSSLFRPHITSVGLYNDDNELLVIGKLSQPIKSSNETDTTFVLRWDT